MKNQKQLIDRAEVYRRACAGCTRHGEAPMECYHDEPCERLILNLQRAEPVNAVEVVRCKDCKHYNVFRLECHNGHMNGIIGIDGFCSYGERRTDEK